MKSLYKDIKKSLLKHYAFAPMGHACHRLEVLVGMICSCLSNQNCNLENLSSDLPDIDGCKRKKESKSAQAKRWLKSKWTDYKVHFQPFIVGFIQTLAQRNKELFFVIDGSETGTNCVSLMISLVWGKRSIPIIWFTREGAKGHFPEQMHIDLANALSDILGALDIKERVIILGDGEFDGNKWIECLASKGWEYVLRTSLDRKVNNNDDIFPISMLPVDKHLQCGFALHGFNKSHAVLWHSPKYKYPIPIITNIEVAKMACKYYKKRFAIETLFKDLKSNGFNIQNVKISDPYRIQNLLIVVCLAFLFTFAIGKAAKIIGKDLDLIYRNDRIMKLSHFKLGLKIIAFCKNNTTCISQFFSKSFCFFITIQT
jgi:hypothetical protein